MKKQIRFSSVHLLAIFLVALLSASVQAQYTFGPQVQSTPSASITYDSGTDAFQYTDAANLSDDRTYLPLSGTAATFLTVSNGWTASFTVNISTRSMTQSNGNNPVIGITLAIVSQNGPNIFSQSVRMTLSQKSDTGANNLNYPPGFYGTAAQFIALTNGSNDVTTPLGTSVYLNGGSFLFLSGGMNASSTTESYNAITGDVTLNYNPSTKTVTGYFDGNPVGSYFLANWGSNPQLTFIVSGGSGEGVAVPAGTATASNFSVGLLPELAISSSGTNFILTWPTNATGFTLQATTNLSSSAVWATNSLAPAVVNGQNTVTNPVSGTQMFYRLSN